MQLTVITPNGREINFVIDDWTPISEGKELTNVGLALIEEDQAKMLKHALEYHSIKVSVGTDYLLILDAPHSFIVGRDKLRLHYKTI